MRCGIERRPGGADGPDQRRRRDVSVSDLFEVVLRVQQDAPEHPDQLPVDWIGRRHPAGHERDRLLRRDRRSDDRRSTEGGARTDSALPDRARRRCPRLQYSWRERRAEVHRSGAGRHLPRQDHEVERSGDREAQPGRDAAGDRHRRGAPRRWFGDDLHLGRLPGEGLARVEDQGRRRHVRELAGRSRRKRATRAWRDSCRRRRARLATSS